jgi:hypothetical protein
MAAPTLEREIDRLYQLPLVDFTTARNVLAKTGGARVRALVKPTLPAWAVNQVYWRDRAAWDALIAAAEAQRRAHHAVLAGRKADLRAAGRSHDEAVDAALKSALAILAGEDHPVTEATRQGIVTTLRALPGDEPAGRLTRTLQPGGFEMLAGLTVAGTPDKPSKPAPAPRSAKRGTRSDTKPAGDRKAVARARAQVEEAARTVRQTEQGARREEFEAARAAREAEKVERAAVAAREAYEAAREGLEEAEAAVPPAARAREAAARRAQQSATALERARAALAQAEARLAALAD